MFFKKKRHTQKSDEQHGEETVAQPARTVIKRAIRKITVRPALRRSIPLPNLKLRSNSEPEIVCKDMTLLTMRRGHGGHHDATFVQGRHASWPALLPQGTEDLPVSESDISKLFRRNTVDSISSSGRHIEDLAGGHRDHNLPIRHVENHLAQTPELVSPAESVDLPSSAAGVVPDILATPTYVVSPGIPCAPPPTPWDAQARKYAQAEYL